MPLKLVVLKSKAKLDNLFKNAIFFNLLTNLAFASDTNIFDFSVQATSCSIFHSSIWPDIGSILTDQLTRMSVCRE